MKLVAVAFDVDEEPSVFTVTATARELALIYAFVGSVSPRAVTEASDLEWGTALHDLGDDLGSIGNRFYESGWDRPKLTVRVGAP